MSKQEDKNGIVYTSNFDASKNIRVSYEDENAFNKQIRGLKQYNMLAYKDFIFNLMANIRAGKTIGEQIGDNLYKVDLLSDRIFEFVYGKVYFVYSIVDEHIALLKYIEPKEFLAAGHQRQLPTYKGVPIIGPKDRFKVDLYLTIEEKKNKELPKITNK